MLSSTLPLELEREIFELAATASYGAPYTLCLVAHRVKVWIEPYLYGLVVYNGQYPKPPFAKHGHKIRHLLVGGNISTREVSRILSLTHDLVSFGYWPVEFDSYVGNYLFDLPRLANLTVPLADGTRSLPSSLTHLDIGEFLNHRYDAVNLLSNLPKLTHLSLTEPTKRLIAKIFQHAKNLVALVITMPHPDEHDRFTPDKLKYKPTATRPFISTTTTSYNIVDLVDFEFQEESGWNQNSETDTDMELETIIRDPRVVIVQVLDPVEDWLRRCRNREDLWTVAVDCIEKRRNV